MADNVYTPLKSGYNVVINQKVGDVNTPIYPFTRTANVKNAEGKSIDDILAGLSTDIEGGRYVPEAEAEVSNLRFLRNDGTWASVQSASTTQSGVVQLSDATNLADSTVAATSKAVSEVKSGVDKLAEDVAKDYVKKIQLGSATTTVDGQQVVGVATLDTTGLIPTSQLPSYVDEVIEVTMDAGHTTATNGNGDTIEPEAGKIYVDCLGEGATGKIFRWSGSVYVVISETIALGETSSTAFRGDQGKAAYEHSTSAHARTDATAVAASDTNGYIKINDVETSVYIHPTVDGGSATNPHGTTASDIGLGKVENKTAAEILAELTSSNVTTALGYTPANVDTLATTSQNGLMTTAQVTKLNNCMPTSISEEVPTTDGLWFEIVTDAPAGV